MAINTNIKDMRPRRDKFKREITLPSRGFSNPKAWPNGKITVFPWDNLVNDWLLKEARRNAAKVDMVYGLLERLCDLNGGKVDDFVATEINIILLVARAINNNCVLSYTVECPKCDRKEDGTIAVPDELAKVGEKPEGYTGYDVITLPECRDEVTVRPLLVKDEKAIERKINDATNTIPEYTLRSIWPITAIGGGRVEALEEVLQWYLALSPKDLEELAKRQAELSPQLDSRVHHKCDGCGTEILQSLDIKSSEFFR